MLTFVPAKADEARQALVADLDEVVEAGTADVRSRLSQSLVGAFGERVKAPLTAVLDSASTASSAESVSASSALENATTALSSSGGPPPPTDSSGLWARVSDVAAAAWTVTAAEAEPALGADGLNLDPRAAATVVAALPGTTSSRCGRGCWWRPQMGQGRRRRRGGRGGGHGGGGGGGGGGRRRPHPRWAVAAQYGGGRVGRRPRRRRGGGGRGDARRRRVPPLSPAAGAAASAVPPRHLPLQVRRR
ncbi:hypothetical protein I4F81_011643 [Pyropia yezoensis]|uniref:Uncharacterized protein n=1 Tax=Pyropia yezoensis TaxID=2788 RepID=A0ACC3CG58_PYRYE|nr:hypothetical protein I4F81_011643 [Neopyropia yezoensis]